MITRQLTDQELKVLNLQGYDDARDLSEEDLAYKVSVITPLVLWKASMAEQEKLGGIPRWFEDYITENSITLANGKVKDSYDAKVARRAEKP